MEKSQRDRLLSHQVVSCELYGNSVCFQRRGSEVEVTMTRPFCVLRIVG